MKSLVVSAFIKFVSSILIWIFLAFTFVPFFLLTFTFRFLLSKLVPLIYEGITKILTTTNSIFATPDESKCHVVFCFELEGLVELNDVCSTFESRVIQKKKGEGVLQWPEFQQFIVQKCGYPFWKWDKSFNIQKHVRMLQVDPKFGENGLSAQDILDVIEERVIHKPFLPQQSPWEILIVSNFQNLPNYGSGIDENGIGTMLLFHCHHAFGDGTIIGKVFEDFFDGGNIPSNPLVPKRDDWFSSIWEEIKFYFFGPYELIIHGNKVIKTYWYPNSKKLNSNAAITPTIPAEFIKTIAKSNRVTFSSVVLTAIGNALVKFMKEAGYEVPEKMPCSVPRLLVGHARTKLAHQLSVAQALFPTQRGPEQLETIQGTLTACNLSRVPRMYFLVIKILGTLWTNLSQPITANGTGELVLTNLPVFNHELRFNGRNKMRSITCYTRIGNYGNGIVVISAGCHEGVRFLFQIDEGIVPRNQLHAQVFIKYFLQELESMSLSTPQNSVSVS